ncbi:MAG TPA: GH25 family lysozyme, partial [Polyangiaceae bacterium]
MKAKAIIVLGLVLACGGGSETTSSSESEINVCASGATTYGVDVSEFQGDIDWNAVKSSGHDFAFIRVADGFYFDAKFGENWQNAGAAGVARGAYHFFRPGEDATQQADFFLAHVAGGELSPALDVEVTDGQSSATIVAGIGAWVARVEQATGKTPIVYTAPGFWNAIGGADAFGTSLWVAHWFTACPQMPSSWGNWQFWQYADNGSVPGIGGAVDLDVFNGPPSALAAAAPYEVAFQANTTNLWTTRDGDWKLGMAKGTSPSIASLTNGGHEIAFQANTTDLWTVGDGGWSDWHLGMMPGTSPSIAALSNGGFEVAFQS